MNDQEDILEFGIKRENAERRDGGCAIVFDPKTQKYAVYENLKNGVWGLFGGGFNEGEDEKDGVLRELVEESGLINFLYIERIGKTLTHYYNSNKGVNRVAYATCFLVILENSELKPTQLEEHEKFKLIWATNEEIISKWESINQNKDYDHWVYFFEKTLEKMKDLGYIK